MDLTGIKRACLRAKRFQIVNTDDRMQWFSNGQAFWPVEGIHVTESAIPELFDLSEKQLNKLDIETIDTDDKRFSRHERTLAQYVRQCADYGAVWWNGWLFRALHCVGYGLFFLLVDNLKPAQLSDEYAAYYVLPPGEKAGDFLIAATNGMLVDGLLKPMDYAIADKILEQTQIVASMSLFAPSSSDAAETAAEALAEQMSIERNR